MNCDNYCNNRYKTPNRYKNFQSSATCLFLPHVQSDELSVAYAVQGLQGLQGGGATALFPEPLESRAWSCALPKVPPTLPQQWRATLGAEACTQPCLLPSRAGAVWGCCLGCPSWATAALWPHNRVPPRNSFLCPELSGAGHS